MNPFNLPLTNNFTCSPTRYPFCCPQETYTGNGYCYTIRPNSSINYLQPGWDLAVVTENVCLINRNDFSNIYSGIYGVYKTTGWNPFKALPPSPTNISWNLHPQFPDAPVSTIVYQIAPDENNSQWSSLDIREENNYYFPVFRTSFTTLGVNQSIEPQGDWGTQERLFWGVVGPTGTGNAMSPPRLRARNSSVGENRGSKIREDKASGVLFFSNRPDISGRSIWIGPATSNISLELYKQGGITAGWSHLPAKKHVAAYYFKKDSSITGLNDIQDIKDAINGGFGNASVYVDASLISKDIIPVSDCSAFKNIVTGKIWDSGILFVAKNSGISGNGIKLESLGYIENEIVDLDYFWSTPRSYVGSKMDNQDIYYQNRANLLDGGSEVYQNVTKKYFTSNVDPVYISPCPPTGIYEKWNDGQNNKDTLVKKGFEPLPLNGTVCGEEDVEPQIIAACDPVFSYLATYPEIIRYNTASPAQATGVRWCRKSKSYVDAQVAPLPFGPKTYFYGETDEGSTKLTLHYHSMVSADVPGLIRQIDIDTVLHGNLSSGWYPYSGTTSYYINTGLTDQNHPDYYRAFVKSGFFDPVKITNPIININLGVDELLAIPVTITADATGATALGNRIASFQIGLRNLIGKLHRFKKLGGIVYQDLKSIYNNTDISGALSVIDNAPVYSGSEVPDRKLAEAYELYWKGSESTGLSTLINYAPNFQRYNPNDVCSSESGWCRPPTPPQIRIACRAGVSNVEVPRDVWDEACRGCGETQQRMVMDFWGVNNQIQPKRSRQMCFPGGNQINVANITLNQDIKLNVPTLGVGCPRPPFVPGGFGGPSRRPLRTFDKDVIRNRSAKAATTVNSIDFKINENGEFVWK